MAAAIPITGAYSLVVYYANLLILQYAGKSKAYQHVATAVTPVVMPQQTTLQRISFDSPATAGSFDLSWNGSGAVTINWNDTAAAIQTKLQSIPVLAGVTVAGSIASRTLNITMTGVASPAKPLSLANATLASVTGDLVGIMVQGYDYTMPQLVMHGFNLNGTFPAVGKQLDIIGKYAGVVRTGLGFFGPITLNDADFMSLIRMAIIKNSSDASLATIQAYIQRFFPGQMFVFDYQNMQMSYMISAAVGSANLIQLFVNQKLLPRPLGVGLSSVIYAPVVNTFFGFGTYAIPAANVSPFNTYTSYNMNSPWLSYANGVSLPQ